MVTLIMCLASCALFSGAYARGAVLVKDGKGSALSHDSGFYGSLISHDHIISTQSSRLPQSVSPAAWEDIKGLLSGTSTTCKTSFVNDVVVARASENASAELHKLASHGNVFAMLEYAVALHKQLGSSASSFEQATVFAHTFVGCIRLYAILRSTVFKSDGNVDVSRLSHEVATFVAPIFKHYQEATGFLFDSTERATDAWEALIDGGVMDQVIAINDAALASNPTEYFFGARADKVDECISSKIGRFRDFLRFAGKTGSSPEFVRLANGVA